MRALAAAPRQAGPLLKDRLRPAPGKPLSAAALARLIAQLDDDDFDARERAQAALEKEGESAEPALVKALAGEAPPERKRRVRDLLARLRPRKVPADMIRPLRAVEVLEWIATPEARKVLARLAGGRPDAILTREAKASLLRLKRTAHKH
jgi:hypothetical protein